MSELQDVRDLKRRWHNLMTAQICGYGLAPTDDGGWALKVNTRWTPNGDVPAEIDGIPIIVEMVGLVAPAITT